MQDIQEAGLIPDNISHADKVKFEKSWEAYRKKHGENPSHKTVQKYFRDLGHKALPPQAAKVIQTDTSKAEWEAERKRKGEESLRKRREAEEHTRIIRENGGKNKKRKLESSGSSGNGSKDRHDHSNLAPKEKVTGILAQKNGNYQRTTRIATLL